MLEIHDPDPADLRALVAEYERLEGTVILRGGEGQSVLVRFPTCLCCRSGRVIPTLEASGHLYLPPSTYASEGDEVYQFLTRGASVGASRLAELAPSVEVVATGVRPLTELGFEEGFLVPVGSLFRDLTPRQRLAIVTATRRGYYRIPRPVTTAELAEELAVSRVAFEALLRKAENKLVAGLFPYLVLGEHPVEAKDPPTAGPTGRPTGRGRPRSS